MKYFLILCFLFFAIIFTSFKAFSNNDCYEKISYPSGMFGTFQNKMTTSTQEIQRIFVFGKEKLKEKPKDMLFGLAYLEVMVNQLCEDKHNFDAIKAKEKIVDITDNIRDSLGLSIEMKRSKIINIYWSTGKLLSLARVKKIKINKERENSINLIRDIKSLLKRSIKRYINENFG